MKQSVLALTLILLSGMAHADIAEKFQENCLTPQNKNIIGTKGSCRIVIIPKKVERKGACTGLFNKNFPCLVSFISVPQGSMMNLTCGLNPKSPDVDKDMPAEAIGYNVSTLIKRQDGTDLVQNDMNQYTMFNSQILLLELTDSVGRDMKKKLNGIITLMLEEGPVKLTDVTCR